MDGTLTQNECDSRFVAGQRGVRNAYPWSRWDRRDVKTLSSDSGWSTSQIKAVSPRVAHVITEAVLCTFLEPQPSPLKALALWFVCKLRLFRIQDPLLFTKKPSLLYRGGSQLSYQHSALLLQLMLHSGCPIGYINDVLSDIPHSYAP